MIIKILRKQLTFLYTNNLNTVIWYQEFISNTINFQNRSILPIVATLKGSIAPDLSGPWSNGNEWTLHISQNSDAVQCHIQNTLFLAGWGHTPLLGIQFANRVVYYYYYYLFCFEFSFIFCFFVLFFFCSTFITTHSGRQSRTEMNSIYWK